MTDAKILLFDIECSMLKAYTYGLWDQNIPIENIIEHPRMIAFSAKWYGKKGTMFFSEFHHSRKEMLEAIHALLEEADIVVGFNSRSFDVKWVNSEFWVDGMKPPAPYKQIDLRQAVKANFRFVSGKLDYIVGRILDDSKHRYSMAEMWRIVDNPNTPEEVRKREWNKMKRYALKDTNLLDPLLTDILPWIKMPHPRTDGSGLACRNCGSYDLRPRGYALTLQGKYARYRCECGTWQRGTHRLPVGETRSL